MARTKGSVNTTHYKWKLIKDNQTNLFRTSKEISTFLDVTIPTLYRFIKNNETSTKLKNINIQITKVNIPCFVLVANTGTD